MIIISDNYHYIQFLKYNDIKIAHKSIIIFNISSIDCSALSKSSKYFNSILSTCLHLLFFLSAIYTLEFILSLKSMPASKVWKSSSSRVNVIEGKIRKSSSSRVNVRGQSKYKSSSSLYTKLYMNSFSEVWAFRKRANFDGSVVGHE